MEICASSVDQIHSKVWKQTETLARRLMEEWGAEDMHASKSKWAVKHSGTFYYMHI